MLRYVLSTTNIQRYALSAFQMLRYILSTLRTLRDIPSTLQVLWYVLYTPQILRYVLHINFCFSKTSLTSQDTTGEETTDDYPVDTPPEPPPPKRQCRRDSSRDFESQLIKLLTDHKRQESDRAEDDDRYFLLSMLPSFKNLDEETKLKTRIEMLQVLQRSITACNQSRTEQLSAIFVPKLEFEEPPSPTYESSRALPSSTCNHVDLWPAQQMYFAIRLVLFIFYTKIIWHSFTDNNVEIKT